MAQKPKTPRWHALRGTEALRQWSATQDGAGLTKSAQADALGLARSQYARLRSGADKAGLLVAYRIEQVTEGAVPAEWWIP